MSFYGVHAELHKYVRGDDIYLSFASAVFFLFDNFIMCKEQNQAMMT